MAGHAPDVGELKTASEQAADGADMAADAAAGDSYSPWCPTTWVETGVSTTVDVHVDDTTVGGTHGSGWVDSSVGDLPPLADLDWMSTTLTDSASSAEEDNGAREIPSSPPLEPPRSPPNDTVCKLEVRHPIDDLSHGPAAHFTHTTLTSLPVTRAVHAAADGLWTRSGGCRSIVAVDRQRYGIPVAGIPGCDCN